MFVVEKKKKQPKRDRELFKKTLNKLMVSRDIFYWKDLRAELEKTGYEIGQSQLSQYVNGQRDPEDLEELFAAIGRALGLSRDEKMLLAFSYAYPQGNGEGNPTGGASLPGGARSADDLRDGLGAAAEARQKDRSGNADDRAAN